MFQGLKWDNCHRMNWQRLVLTNTYVVFASVTNAVRTILANHCVVTFWAYNATTVYIRFILISDIIATCVRRWNERICTGWIYKDWYLPIHMLFSQMLLRQSKAFSQYILLLHFGHKIPPQSASVSSWFLILSLHDTVAAIKEIVLFGIHKD
jgi:hypothetical protein